MSNKLLVYKKEFREAEKVKILIYDNDNQVYTLNIFTFYTKGVYVDLWIPLAYCNVYNMPSGTKVICINSFIKDNNHFTVSNKEVVKWLLFLFKALELNNIKERLIERQEAYILSVNIIDLIADTFDSWLLENLD